MKSRRRHAVLPLIGGIQVALFLPLGWFFVIYREFDPPALVVVLLTALVSTALAVIELVVIFFMRRLTPTIALAFSVVLLMELVLIVWLSVVGAWQIHTGP